MLRWPISQGAPYPIHEAMGSQSGTGIYSEYLCDFSVLNNYVLSKFILDITDVGRGKKHPEETWTYY